MVEHTLADPPLLGRSGVRAWIAYDFINSLIVINGSLHFSAWITIGQGVNPFWYGFTFVISTIIQLGGLPFLGAFIDRHKNGRQVLFVLSLLLAALALLITGLGHRSDNNVRIIGTLAAFGLINLIYQTSLVAYNWLLIQLNGVCNASDVRLISGIGEGAGNAGSVVGAVLGIGLISLMRRFGHSDPTVDIFFVLAVVFAVLFVFVYVKMSQDMKLATASVPSQLTLGASIGEAVEMLRRPSPIRLFFIAFILFADGILTVQLYLPIYMTQGLGFTSNQAASGFALALTAAAAGGILYSRASGRSNVRAIILGILVLWVPTLIALACATTFLTVMCILVVAGFLNGLLWSSSRAYVIELAPSDKLGRILGFFSVFERAASIVGPLLWGGAMLLPLNMGIRYGLAFGAMSALVAGGGLVLWLGSKGTPTIVNVVAQGLP